MSDLSTGLGASGGPADEPLAIGLARALVGGHACRRAGLTPLDETDRRPSGPGPYLTRTPYWPLGYPMITELLVLERLENPASAEEPGGTPGEGDTDEAAQRGGSGVTWGDQALSDAAAFFFDELVNPVLPYTAIAPGVAQTPPLNRPYERAVAEAVFARHPEGSGAAAEREAARRLLYETGAAGESVASQVQLTYWEHAERVEAARAALEAALPPDATDADRAAAATALDRARADWEVIGRRTEVEAAMQLLATPDLESRNTRLQNRLQASLQLRVDRPGESYAVSRLVPVAPLLTEGDNGERGGHGWERVEVDREAARKALTELARTALVPSPLELELALEDLELASFEFLTCAVQREWLAEELFSANDWDLPGGRRLADGQGGGPLGGYASAMLFVRGVSLRYAGAPTARFGPSPNAGPAEPVVRVVASAEQVAGRERDEVAAALAAADRIGLVRAATLLRRQRDRPAPVAVRGLRGTTLDWLSSTGTVAVDPLPADRNAGGPPRGGTDARGRSIRPGLVASVVRGASMAKPRQRLSRVRDRVLGASGGVRGSRDGADHTTSRRRRVRHRRTRVRDHRGRTRVRDHRGRTQEQSLLAFSVTLTAPRPDLLEGLTLHGESTTGQELDFPLRRVVDAASPTLECEVQVTLDPAEDESQEWTLTLATADGQTLDTQDVSAPEGEVDALKLTWHITVPSVVVEVTSPVTPTLYGYALHVVPACPEPDPTLDWSGVDIGSDPTTEEPV